MSPSTVMRCVNWVQNALGANILYNRRERAMRALEEAIELAQACGVPAPDASAILSRVYSKPPGTVEQEAAGSLFTLIVLAWVYNFSLKDQLLKELKRVEDPTIFDKVREKHRIKVKLGIGLPLEGMHAQLADEAEARAAEGPFALHDAAAAARNKLTKE